MTGFNREFWDGTKPLTPGLTRLIDRDLAAVGHQAWTDVEQRRNAHDDPLGGIIVAITHREVVDDAGEIRRWREFRCFDPQLPTAVAFRTFSEDLIAAIEASATSELVRAVRRFCSEICDHHNRRQPALMTGGEAQLVVDAYHLTAAVMGGIL